MFSIMLREKETSKENLSREKGSFVFVLEHGSDRESDGFFFERLVVEFLGEEDASVHVVFVGEKGVSEVAGVNQSAEHQLPFIILPLTFLLDTFSLSNFKSCANWSFGQASTYKLALVRTLNFSISLLCFCMSVHNIDFIIISLNKDLFTFQLPLLLLLPACVLSRRILTSELC